jgi:hypothetical protein
VRSTTVDVFILDVVHSVGDFVFVRSHCSIQILELVVEVLEVLELLNLEVLEFEILESLVEVALVLESGALDDSTIEDVVLVHSVDLLILNVVHSVGDFRLVFSSHCFIQVLELLHEVHKFE